MFAICLVPQNRISHASLRPEASPTSSGSSSSVESVTLPVGEKETIDQTTGSMVIAATASSDDTGDDEGHPSTSGYGVGLGGDDQLDSG